MAKTNIDLKDLLSLLKKLNVLGLLKNNLALLVPIIIVILAILLPLVPLVFLPRGKVFEDSLQEAKAKDAITPELRRQMADPVVRWAHRAEMIGVVLIVILMVVKPF